MSNNTSVERRPRIALTLGDPAGVGPELAAKLLARPQTLASAEVYILADASEVAAAAQVAGVSIPISDTPKVGYAVVLDDGTAPAVPIETKKVSLEAGQRVKHQLHRALALPTAVTSTPSYSPR